MTQKHIRRLAGFEWVKRVYYRFHQPHIVSAIYGAICTLAVLVSIYLFINPPETVVRVADNPWLLGIALVSLAVGGTLGSITVATGRHWLERYAAALVIGTTDIYSIVTAWITLFSGGSLILSLFTTTLAIVCVLLRFFWINDHPYIPATSAPKGGLPLSTLKSLTPLSGQP